MRTTKTKFSDAFILEPCIIADHRGTFRESFRQSYLRENGVQHDFIQENTSTSKQGVARGLHFQTENPQAKLVSCLKGAIKDIIVDLRKSSPTFGEWEIFELSSDNERQLYVPAGFAHGFIALTEATVNYKCSTYWDKDSDGGIYLKSLLFGYPWGVMDDLIMSPKDLELPDFNPERVIFP